MVEAGNDAIDIEIRRHRYGIKLKVKVLPEVESFFEQWGGGLQERPTHGRLWSQEPLTLWAFGLQNIGPSVTRPYSLLHSGSTLTIENGHPNISFLRLVGASAPEGREIIIEAVMGRSEIVQLAQRISDACNMFYSEYLQDVHMRAVVSVFRLPTAA